MKKVVSVIAFTFFIANFLMAGKPSGSLIASATYDSDYTAAVTTANITGKIVDHVSGESLAGVFVQVNGDEIKAYTDLDGNFTLKDMQPGHYDIIVSYISYETNVVHNVELNAGDAKEVVIKIQSKE